MKNDFRVLLQAVLDSNSIGQDDINKIQNVISKYHLNLTADLDKASVIAEIKKIVPQLETELKKMTGIDIQINDSDLIKAFDQIKKQAESTAQKVNKIQLSLDNGDYDTQILAYKTSLEKLGLSADEISLKMKGVNTAFTELKTSTTGDNIVSDDVISKAQTLETEMSKLSNTVKQIKLTDSLKADDLKVDSTIVRLNEQLRKNSAYSSDAKAQIKALIAELEKGNVAEARLREINVQAKQLHANMAQAGKIGLNTFDKLRQAWEKFGGWSFATGTLTAGLYQIKEAVSELKELDSILTEISKTSDLTSQQLKDLGDSAFETASKYGRTASDYLTGVQEMYRAGFSNAEQMSELSILAQAAGDMDSTTANDYLIASDAAYDLKGNVEELNKVLDGQNYITNNAAVSMNDMAQATSEAASIAAQYGVSIDELSALIATATSKTRESGSETGNALKALFVNLQDTTSKPIKEAFDAVGISMTEMVNGSERLKTPIQLLKELSDVFVNLDEGDTRRANILSDIGGKYHANTLSAILSDWASYEKMLDLYSQGMGSAAEEAEKSATNIEGSLNKLSNTWTDTVENVINSDVILNVVNALNGLLGVVNNITDALGSLGTIGLGVGLFAGIKNVGRDKMYSLICYLF